LTYPSEKYESQLGLLFPIWKNKKCSKPGLFETMVACVPWRPRRLCCVTGINFSYSANSEQQEPTKSIQITKKRKWSVLVAVGQPELAYLFWAGRILDCQKPDADADRASARPEQVGSLKNHPVLEAKTNRPVFEVNKPSNFKHTKSSGSGAHDNYEVTEVHGTTFRHFDYAARVKAIARFASLAVLFCCCVDTTAKQYYIYILLLYIYIIIYIYYILYFIFYIF